RRGQRARPPRLGDHGGIPGALGARPGRAGRRLPRRPPRAGATAARALRHRPRHPPGRPRRAPASDHDRPPMTDVAHSLHEDAAWLGLARWTRRLAWASLIWMAIEGAVGLGAGVQAGSI